MIHTGGCGVDGVGGVGGVVVVVVVSPPVRFCVPPPFVFIIYNPTLELGEVLVPTYRRLSLFLRSSFFLG